MTEELKDYLCKYGLHEKWLAILHKLEIQTVDDFRSKICNNVIRDKMLLEAEDNEKIVLDQLYLKVDTHLVDGEDKTLENYLANIGLYHSIVCEILKEEDVLTVQQLEKVTGDVELYGRLAISLPEEERKILLKILKIDHNVAAEQEVKCRLDDKGLVSRYWFPIFKRKFGCTSPLLFNYLDSRSCLKLKCYIRNKWEENALKEFLGMDFDMAFAKQRKRDKDKIIRRQKEAWEAMVELEQLEKQGKTLEDLDVKMKEQKIQAALMLSDEDWIMLRDDCSLLNTVNISKEWIAELDLQTIAREDLSEVDVMQHASKGLALKGIFITRDNDERLLPRKSVLTVPSGLHLSAPSISSRDCMKEFLSKRKDDIYMKTLENLGYSVAASLELHDKEAVIETGRSYSPSHEKNGTGKDDCAETYYAQVNYVVVPIASCSIDFVNLSLNEEVIHALQMIEMTAQEEAEGDSIQKECDAFFEEFGSHVNLGKIQLGGIYMWKAISRSCRGRTPQSLKELTKEAIDTFIDTSNGLIGVRVDVPASKLKGKFSGSYDKSYIQNMTLTVKTIGGPDNAPSFPQWKSGLVGSNATWAVIDRGFNFQGIWELIKKHKQSFVNPDKLARILCSVWEGRSELKAGQYLNPNQLLQAQEKLSKISHFLDKCISDPTFVKNCDNYLETIAEEIEKIIISSRNPSLWVSSLEQQSIAGFFEVVHKNKGSYDNTKVNHIQFLVKRLLQGAENSQFQEKEALLKWTKASDSSTPETEWDFVFLIRNVRDYITPRLSKEQLWDASDSSDIGKDGEIINATVDFAVYISYFLERLFGSRDYLTANMLVLLLVPLSYDTRNKCFDVLLSRESLEMFLKNLDERRRDFQKHKERGLKEAEAYLLHMVLELTQEYDDTYERELNFSDITEQIKIYFSSQTKQLLNRYGKPPIQWEKLESTVLSMMSGTSYESVTNTFCGNGLMEIIQSALTATEIHEKTTKNSSPQWVKVESKGIVKYDVIEKLGLSSFYPNMIEVQDILQRSVDKVDSLHDVPWIILHKLLMQDYRGRNSNFWQGTLAEDTLPTKDKTEGECQSDVSKDELVNNILAMITDVAGENFKMVSIHPLDVLVAIFLCCTNLLRQVLAEKMFMCQVSIPFILPDVTSDDNPTLLLWAMQRIILEFKLPNGRSFEKPVVSEPSPVVSFIRLGDLSRSKSKLLNDIISVQGHCIFFHRDCDNGCLEKKIALGLVDIAWFLPSTDVECQFHDTITFMNLHGDARNFRNCCQLMCKISDVVTVMVDVEELQDSTTISALHGITFCASQIVLIVTKKSDRLDINTIKKILENFIKGLDGNSIKDNIIFDFNHLGPKNISELKKSVISVISRYLTGKKGTTLEECKKLAETFNIGVDENDPACLQGKELSLAVMQYIDKDHLSTLKSTMLPLQGDLWKEWGRLEKKEHRKEGKANYSPEHYVAHIHEKKLFVRRGQLLMCNSPTKMLEVFIMTLLQWKGSIRLYFLRWLKLYLDGLSRISLPQILGEYRLKWNEIQKHKKEQKGTQGTFMCNLQKELCKLEEKLRETSFGLEHLMREVGQAYEAVAELSEDVSVDLRENICELPKVVAELMLSGYPLELMDGDVSHVPRTWVKAVFSKLKELVGDKNLFVLSVLGVQSSGKSTLLNTLFGLQFAVSAGRCTQGVYGQLVPVPKDRLNNQYDYIFVLDTEGLRAPEFGKERLQHDNEMATFVIGMGDLTIINIKGENPTEMQDVLQIVVHAFLRLQQVNRNLKLQPSCFFIHQNVGAVNAATMLMFGQQKLLDCLDKMTQAAADQEDVKDITSFRQIIDFDVEENVLYFPGLWQGDPPMAPTNPGYSDKVNELKMKIFRDMLVKNSHSSFSKMSHQITDLWNGILAENFVFSFKNSLELKAYSSLEYTYCKLSWSLQNDAVKWFNGARNEIKSCEMGIERLRIKLNEDCTKHLSDKYDAVLKRLQDFFESSYDKNLLEQWRQRSELKLKQLKDEILARTLKDCKNELEIRELQVSQSREIVNFKEDVLKEAQTLAINLQDEVISDRGLERSFTKLWCQWKTKFSLNYSFDDHFNVKGEVRTVLFDILHSYSFMLEEELWQNPLSYPIPTLEESNLKITDKHITIKKKYFFIDAAIFPQCEKIVRDNIKILFRNIREYIVGLEGINFNRAQAVHVVNMVRSKIDSVNMSNISFKIKYQFQVVLVVHVCRYAVHKFEALHEKFKQKIDPRITLEVNYRNQLLTLFKNIYKRSSQEVAAAEMFLDTLKSVVEAAVGGDIAREAADNVRNCVPSLHSKGNLMRSILEDLLEKKSFDEYYLYISNTEVCLRKWLQYYTDRFLFERRKGQKTRYTEIATRKIQSLIASVVEQVKKCTDEVREEKDIHKWIKIFLSGLKNKLPLAESDLSLMTTCHINDYAFLQDRIISELKVIEKKLGEHVSNITGVDCSSENARVYDLLANECLGCCEQCPFCKSPCSLMVHGHEVAHTTIQHYPQGVGTYIVESTGKLCLENCCTLVCSTWLFKNLLTNSVWHPYKDYKHYYPDWDIQRDATMDTSLYWKWFMTQFAFQLSEKYNAKMPDIPDAWKKITPQEAKASLQ